MIGRSFLALVMAVLAVASVPFRVEAQEPLGGSALVEALRGGGYVLLFRHAATDRAQSDVDRQNLESCQTQRNLSALGREQAGRIGETVRRLAIPVGKVLASPYCRTLDTARLAFGEAEVSPDLISEISDDAPGSRARLTDALRAMLAQPPEPGTNVVLVTHVLNIEDALGYEIEEGEVAVARPDGAGGFAIVARVPADWWAALEAGQ